MVLAHAASNATVAVVPDCGHLIALEVPESAIRTLVDLQDVNVEETENSPHDWTVGKQETDSAFRRLPACRYPGVSANRFTQADF